jgi:hypothetical protein
MELSHDDSSRQARRAELAGLREERTALAGRISCLNASFSRRTSGRPEPNDPPVKVLESMLEAKMERLMEVHEKIAQLEDELGEGAAAAAAVPVASTSATAPPTLQPRAGDNQRTLHGFVKIVGDGGIMRDLPIPSTIRSAAPASCTCDACGKVLKNHWGLVSHTQHCEARRARAPILAPRPPPRATPRWPFGAAPASSSGSTAPTPLGSAEPPSSDGEAVDSDATSSRSAARSGDGNGSRDERPRGRRGAAHRKSFSLSFKIRVLNVLQAARLEREQGALRQVSDAFGIPSSNLSKWFKHKETILQDYRKTAGNRGRGWRGYVGFAAPRGPKPRFGRAEAIVYSKFIKAREKGTTVGRILLRTWMLKAVREEYGQREPAQRFKASGGWLQDFAQRYNLSVRRQTNKKTKSLEERLHLVRRFHKLLEKYISDEASRGPDSTFSYHPWMVFNADQSPIALHETRNVTYETRGKDVVQIAQREGGEKRFATLQVCVHFDNDKPQPRIMIIFQGQGKRIRPEERAAWDKRVHVTFQRKAWMDGELMRRWVDEVLLPHLNATDPSPDRRAILFLDNLAAQSSEEIREHLAANEVKPWFFPPNCTDLLQPVDRHLARQVKAKVADLLTHRLVEDEPFREAWLGLADGTYPAWKCRVTLTELVGEAWERVCRDRDFRKLGLETGCLMPMSTASREGLAPIKIDGVAEYSFAETALEVPMAAGSGPMVAASGPAPAAGAAVPSTPGAGEGRAVDTGSCSSSTSSKSDSEDEEPPARRRRVQRREMEEDSEGSDASVDVDVDVFRSEYVDDTAEAPAIGLVVPSGWDAELRPEELPTGARLIKRMVLWCVAATRSGAPGWILSEVLGGPRDPKSAAMGITMRLKCNRRLDPGTPEDVVDADGLDVAFNLDNYGTRWVIVKKREVDSA